MNKASNKTSKGAKMRNSNKYNSECGK